MDVPRLPEPEFFDRAVSLVRDYVTRSPGAAGALLDAARRDPEDMTRALVGLGAVLLDIAAGAFSLTPEEMLDKVAGGIEAREG